MPGIIPYANTTESTAISQYSHWACGDIVVGVTHLSKFMDTNSLEYTTGNETVTGICQAGKGYAWGFSFLFTFVVCVLQLTFVLVMYALWFGVHRRRTKKPAGLGVFKDAVTMVSLAQWQCGERLDNWSSERLKQELVDGGKGMTFADEATLVKRRKPRSRSLNEFGESRGGGWGGKVVIDDSR